MKLFIACLTLALLCLSNITIAQSPALQLSPLNPHYFFYKGKATVLVGSGEHYGAVINTAFDYKTYLKTIAKDGLNTTRVFAGAYIEQAGDFGINKNTLAPASAHLLLPWKRSHVPGFKLGGNKFDLSRWDDAYFARLKQFMAAAQQAGVIVEINLFSAYYDNGWSCSALNPANNISHTDTIKSFLVNTTQNGNILAYQENYVRKLVRELNSFDNLYFEIENEPYITLENEVPKDFKNNLAEIAKSSDDWQHKVVTWIKGEEGQLPYKHLISQNIANGERQISQPDPGVSIFNFHYATAGVVAENYHLNKGIGCNETGFAGKADLIYRRQAWRFLMAGGGLFNNLDYSFSAGAEDGRDTSYSAPGGGSPALRKQLGILKRFFDRYNIVKLKPDQLMVTVPRNEITESLSDGKTVWLIYFEKHTGAPYCIKLNRLTRGGKIYMMNVSNGKISRSKVSGDTFTTPAGMDDGVLIVKAVASALP